MASMNTRLNIEKLNGNIVQKHEGSKQVGLMQLGYKQIGFKQLGVKQVGFKQLGPGVKTRVHGVSNDDTAVAQRRLEDKQPEEKTNTDCLVKEQEKEYQTGWKTKTGNSDLSKVFWAEDTTRSTYLVNRSPLSVIGFKKHRDMLGFFGWLASIKQGMLEPVKVKCIFLGYHKSIVEKDDSNEVAFAVAAVEKIYAHESLTFNNTVSYEVISKWKAGLKDDMDARSNAYVLNNGCRK
ncbi:hypothetical protein Tco_0822957 [Tanacetum coccineum]|uniref:Zinc finger, CCHC-type n=1 Tax=Tanacetum coccineum TaxID=301880 RepID=A0ABQ5AKV8_9ASTR